MVCVRGTEWCVCEADLIFGLRKAFKTEGYKLCFLTMVRRASTGWCDGGLAVGACFDPSACVMSRAAHTRRSDAVQVLW